VVTSRIVCSRDGMAMLVGAQCRSDGVQPSV
jgi:hypothetical protein